MFNFDMIGCDNLGFGFSTFNRNTLYHITLGKVFFLRYESVLFTFEARNKSYNFKCTKSATKLLEKHIKRIAVQLFVILLSEKFLL